jgi:hypothetical protein
MNIVLNFRQHFHKDGSFLVTESVFLGIFLFTTEKDLPNGEVPSKGSEKTETGQY